jgi:DNA-binding transcriptional LysR family regulator
LTDAGKAVLLAIRELLRQYDQILEFLSGQSTTLNRVRLAVGSFVAQHYVPRAIAAVRKSHPDCEIETHIARGAERIQGIIDRRYDLAIVSHSPQQIQDILARSGVDPAEICIERLDEHPLCVIARIGTPEGNELAEIPPSKVVPLPRLRGWDLVGLDRRAGLRQQLEKHFSNPDELHFLAEGGGWLAAKEFARHGVGVAIVPHTMIGPADAKQFVIRSMSKDFLVTHSLVYRRDNTNDSQKVLRQALHQSALTTCRDEQENSTASLDTECRRR